MQLEARREKFHKKRASSSVNAWRGVHAKTLLKAYAKDRWLPLYLRDGGKLRTSSAELKKLNLSEMIWNIIPYEPEWVGC